MKFLWFINYKIKAQKDKSERDDKFPVNRNSFVDNIYLVKKNRAVTTVFENGSVYQSISNSSFINYYTKLWCLPAKTLAFFMSQLQVYFYIE